MRTTIAQLSDLHIRAPGEYANERVDTAAFLRQAVADIQALLPTPDALVITGDLADLGRPEEYAHLRELLRPLALPIFLLAGNHDEVQALRAAFPDHAYL